jgi:hypothetical protein
MRQAMENRKDKTQDPREAMTRRLIDAIEQVRLDMAKVELWAYAVRGFSRPVPSYDPKQFNVWVPSEQAKKLGGTKNGNR